VVVVFQPLEPRSGSVRGCWGPGEGGPGLSGTNVTILLLLCAAIHMPHRTPPGPTEPLLAHADLQQPCCDTSACGGVAAVLRGISCQSSCPMRRKCIGRVAFSSAAPKHNSFGQCLWLCAKQSPVQEAKARTQRLHVPAPMLCALATPGRHALVVGWFRCAQAAFLTHLHHPLSSSSRWAGLHVKGWWNGSPDQLACLHGAAQHDVHHLIWMGHWTHQHASSCARLVIRQLQWGAVAAGEGGGAAHTSHQRV
jgi:hypothetical protein